MRLPQQGLKVIPAFNGNGRKHIGHSSRGCSLKRASSCNSATLLSHAFLCFDRCFFLHAALQYLTILHLLHVLRLPPSLPHEAQFVVVVSIVAIVHTCFARVEAFLSEYTFLLNILVSKSNLRCYVFVMYRYYLLLYKVTSETNRCFNITPQLTNFSNFVSDI